MPRADTEFAAVHETEVDNIDIVKSSEPSTYDDAGSLPRLSQRFNRKTGNIRFSVVVGSNADRERRKQGNFVTLTKKPK